MAGQYITSSSLWKVANNQFHFYFSIISQQVEDAWKQTEFIVLPHRDSKDVFILGGVDDVQALLDDSMVCSNILSFILQMAGFFCKYKRVLLLLTCT